ncbi:hypothetical protein OROMI_007810 [Orobanche minor]
MASSQTSSMSLKKKDSIIDGRLLNRLTVVKRVESEHEDAKTMKLITYRIKQTGLYSLGKQMSEVYEEEMVEEFYETAAVHLHSEEKGGEVSGISAVVRGVEVHINRHTLKNLFQLPSSGLKIEEVETYGSDELLSNFWCVFIGNTEDKKVHPSCNKKRFILPFMYLHEFCFRVIENRTGAFDMCTNLRFRLMVTIMMGELVNWCHFLLKRLQEEISKPLSQRKSFGLILNNIMALSSVPFSDKAKKIGPGKFIGGTKPTAYNKESSLEDRPSALSLPTAKNPRDATEKKSSSSTGIKKRKNSEKEGRAEKKHKKAKKSKPTEVSATPVEPAVSAEVAQSAQPDREYLQGQTPVEETVEQLFKEGKSITAPPTVSSPVRASIPEQDPSPVRAPTPEHDPTPHRDPTPVRDVLPEQTPISVSVPEPTEPRVQDRSPSPTQIINATLFDVQVEQAYERFVQWKTYRVSPYRELYAWEDWEAEEKFILEVTDTSDIGLLIRWDNEFCRELITQFYINQAQATAKGKSKTVDAPICSSDSNDSEADDDALQAGLRMSREETQNVLSVHDQGTSADVPSPIQSHDEENAKLQEAATPVTSITSNDIQQEDTAPPQEQEEAERQQKESTPFVPLSTEDQAPKSQPPSSEENNIDAQASPSSHISESNRMLIVPPVHPITNIRRLLTAPEEKLARPGSPKSELRNDRLEALGRQTVFIQDAVDVLNNIAKSLDRLNFSTCEELGSVKSNLANVVEALLRLPQTLNIALSNLQNRQKKLLEEEQAKYSVSESKTAVTLKATRVKLTGHAKLIDDMSLSLQTLATKFSNGEEKQDDVVQLVNSISSAISEIHARKGEEESREAARRWRQQQEAHFSAVLDDSVASAINRLDAPARQVRIADSRPEFHDPRFPWKSTVQCPAVFKLLTDRQPTAEDIKKWRQNELMRYFVKLIKESAIFDRCKTLSDAANSFSSQLQKGVLPLQLAMKSKHKEGAMLTHQDDWILSFDQSYEGKAIYQNRGRDAFVNWWKNTEHDPTRHRPWRHKDHV